MSSTAWRETSYNDTYDKTVISLRRRRAEDGSFTLGDLRRLLECLYVQDGNDWVGRGELQDIIMGATLDAHEFVVAEWEAEEAGT